MTATFTPRQYPAIVRDLLTTLTGGTVREPVLVPAGDGPVVLDRLAERPVRRVSHLEGVIAAPTESDPEATVPYRFTAADFEVVATAGDDDLDAIRFRDDGRRPPAGTTVTVNYYPVQVGPVPLTDVNVGSVVRTLVETFGRELALEELQLEHVYRSAFLETAEASSLDRVVALVGVTRVPRGHAVVKVRFARAGTSTGRITVPTGTVVTDGEDNRFGTLSPLVLEPGEPSRQVLCGGTTLGTQPVDTGAIDRLEVLIAGISTVTNEAPAYRTTAPETDDDLRRRARGALHSTGRGTVDAIEFGVRSIPGVKDVTVTEEPNGVPGEIDVVVAYEQEPDAGLVAAVAERIQDLRPAGIRVLPPRQAQRTEISVQVALTLAGSGVPAVELGSVTSGVEGRIADHIRALRPGGSVRGAQLAALALADARIVDADIALFAGGDPGGGAETSITLSEGHVAEPVVPFTFAAPVTEAGTPPAALVSTVDALVPVHLLPGVTAAEAAAAIDTAAGSHLEGLGDQAVLTVDGLVAAARDESRYVIVREAVLVTVESDGRFLQLTDGVGSHQLAVNERLTLATLDVDVREGSV